MARDRRGWRSPLVATIRLLGLGVVAVLMVLPLYWAVVVSFAPSQGAFRLPPSWFPQHFTTANYRRVFTVIPFWRMLFNSVYITALATLGALVTSTLAAYAFARLRFRGRSAVFGLFIASLMIPGSVMVAPLYIIVRSMHLINQSGALWLPGMVSAFGVFLLRQWFMTIPKSLEEAARLDGANHVQILRHVILPLSGPALATHAILTAQYIWKDFFWPSVVLTDTDKMTLPVGLVFLRGSYSTESPVVIIAAVMMVSLPLIALFLFTQRFITDSVARTGIRA